MIIAALYPSVAPVSSLVPSLYGRKAKVRCRKPIRDAGSERPGGLKLRLFATNPCPYPEQVMQASRHRSLSPRALTCVSRVCCSELAVIAANAARVVGDTDPDRWNPTQWGFIAALKEHNEQTMVRRWLDAAPIHDIIGPKGRGCSKCNMVRKVAQFKLVFKPAYHTALMWCIEYKCTSCANA